MSIIKLFGQLVIGPPGSGKTTYCNGMQQLLTSLGRKVALINIDPANDILPYQCSVDISELVTVEDVMTKFKLGPNGGLLYSMELLETNVEWLLKKLNDLKDTYVIIDCPGQVELYTHHSSMKNIVERLTKWGLQLCAVHLVDSHYCADPGKYIAVLLTSLTTMLQVELPYVHVLSKADLIEKEARLSFNLDFYTEVLDLNFLMEQISDDPFLKKFKKLNEVLAGVIEDYSLVSFIPLNIMDKESILQVLKAVDRAIGYVYGTNEERNIQNLLSTAVGADFDYFKTANIQEKYIHNETEMDE